MPANTLTGADAMVRMLEPHGVRHISGLCGQTTLPLYNAMLQLEHGITHALVRDERPAGYMADGHARVTGRPVVCEGPSGGVSTYLLPGLIEVSETSCAVLGMTSDILVESYGKYLLTEVDQGAPIRPERVIAALQRALPDDGAVESGPGRLHAVLQEAIHHEGPTLIDIVGQPPEEATAPVRRWMG
jgi:hypothetical protein